MTATTTRRRPWPAGDDRTHRLVVVTTPRLGAGFRLAGAVVATAEDPGAAEEAVLRLLAEGERGVIGIHAPFFEAFSAALRARLDASLRPVIVPVPEGREDQGDDDRRARLAALLQRAVGYHLVFGEEDGTG